MWALFRRDPYLRGWPVWHFLGAVTGLACSRTLATDLAAGLVSGLDQSQLSVLPGLPFLVVPIVLMPLLGQKAFRRRFDELCLTLPVSIETVARARLLAMLAASLGPVLIQAVALLVFTPGPALTDSVLVVYLASLLVGAGLWGVIYWHRGIAASAGKHRRGIRGADQRRLDFRAWRLVYRSLGLPRQALPFFAGGGILTAIVFCPGGFSSFLWLPMVMFFLYGINHQAAQALRIIAHLPANRLRLGTAVVLPGLVLGILSIVAVTPLMRTLGWHHGYAGFRLEATRVNGEEDHYLDTDTPPELWRLHVGLDPPSAGSANGEQHAATLHRPLPWMSLGIFNPYEIPRDASLEFAARQIQRLVAAAHGRDLSQDEILQRYIHRTENGLIGRRWQDPATGEFNPFDNDFGGASLIGRSKDLYGALLTFFVFWTMVGVLSFRPRQYPRARMRLRNLSAAWILGAVSGAFVLVSLYVWTLRTYALDEALKGALFRTLGGLMPNQPWLAAVVLLLLAAVSAFWMASRFVHMDLPPKVAAAAWRS